jgi:hypothetical protein
MSRQRITAAYVKQLEQQLSDRDLALVGTLDRLRCATTTQLQRLHVRDGSPATNARRIRSVLSRLVTLGVIARLDRAVGGVRAGSAAYVYSLAPAGQRLGAACGPAGGRRLRKPWTPSVAFLAHRLAITECYVELTEAFRDGQLELLAFDAEPLSWRRFAAPGGGFLTLKPDAFARLAVDEYEHAYFVEIDRATESLPTIGRKLALYRNYWKTGREQHRLRGLFPRVLFVVPDEAREAAIQERIAQQREGAELFAVVCEADALDAMTGKGQP